MIKANISQFPERMIIQNLVSPGGKIDEGETLEEALIREVKEETGLDVHNLKSIFEDICIGSKDGKHFLTTTFSGAVSGEINTVEAGVVKWVDYEVFLAGPFYDYMMKLWHELSDICPHCRSSSCNQDKHERKFYKASWLTRWLYQYNHADYSYCTLNTIDRCLNEIAKEM